MAKGTYAYRTSIDPQFLIMRKVYHRPLVLSIPNTPNHSASDLPASISRRLSMEIIRIAVNYQGSSNHLLQRQPVCHHLQKCVAIPGKKRRQISGMPGMYGSLRVKMGTRIGESSPGTAASLVDMQRKKSAVIFRQSTNLHPNQDPAAQGKKGRRPPNPPLPTNFRHCGWFSVSYPHKYPSRTFYAGSHENGKTEAEIRFGS